MQAEVELLMGLFERVIKMELENFMRLEAETPASLHGYDSPCLLCICLESCDNVLGLS